MKGHRKMTNIENKIDALIERADELVEEINRLFIEGKKQEADTLYNGEYYKICKEIEKLSKKHIASF